MSDEQSNEKTSIFTAKVVMRARRVWRSPNDRNYYVQEFKIPAREWVNLSDGFKHSTSAYAKMGRMYQKEMPGL